MRRRSVWIGLLLTTLLVLTFVGTAFAAPAGPWITPDQPVVREGYLSYDELVAELYKLEATSKGRMKLEIAGYTNLGRAMYVAKFGVPGPGKYPVIIDSQIHGGEPSGTQPLMALMKTLAQSGHKDVQLILDKLCVWFMPMLNADGWEIFNEDGLRTPRRQNVQTWDPWGDYGWPADTQAPGYYSAGLAAPGPGYDINRDFSPNMDWVIEEASAAQYKAMLASQSGALATREAQVATAVFKQLQPKLQLTLHNQGTPSVDGEMVTLSLFGEAVNGDWTDPITGKVYALDPNVIKQGRQAVAYVYDMVEKMNPGRVALYATPNAFYTPGINSGSYNLNGCAICLYECRGVGQKGSGQLQEQVYKGMYAQLLGVANGTIWNTDVNHYFDIPIAGPSLPNPHTW